MVTSEPFSDHSEGLGFEGQPTGIIPHQFGGSGFRRISVPVVPVDFQAAGDGQQQHQLALLKLHADAKLAVKLGDHRLGAGHYEPH